MKLWLIWQSTNGDYDTYDSAVVAAETEEAARRIDPGGYREWDDSLGKWVDVHGDGKREPRRHSEWVDDLDQITVKLIGEARPETKPGAICASFNAG